MDFQKQENFMPNINPHIQIVDHHVSFTNFVQAQPLSISVDSIIPSFKLHPQLFEAIQIQFQKQKSKEGIIFGNELQKSKGVLQFLNIIQQTEEQDIALKISTQSCFCLNFSIIKGTPHKFIEKLKYQIKKCQQLPMNISSQTKSKFTIFEKIYYQLFRGFLAVGSLKEDIRVHKFICYPNINIQIRQTKILPYKYVSNEVFDNIRSGNQTNHQYGYLTLDQRNRIVLVNRDMNIPVTGIWIYSDLLKKKDSPQLKSQAYHLIWAILTDYLIRNSISKYSILKCKKNFLCILSPTDKKPYLYTFQMTNFTTVKWVLTKSTSSLTENIVFDLNNPVQDYSQLFEIGKSPNLLNTHNNYNSNPINSNLNKNQNSKVEKTIQHQQLKKQISSPAHQFMSKTVKSRQFPVFANQTFAKSQADSKSVKDISEDKNSQASYDEKDVKIKILTEQLEFYKAKYEELMQKFFPNPYQYPPQYHQYHTFQYGQQTYQKPYPLISNPYQSIPPSLTQSPSSASYMNYNPYQPQIYNYHSHQNNTPPSVTINQSYIKRSVDQQSSSNLNQQQLNYYQSKPTQQNILTNKSQYQNVSLINKIKNDNNNQKADAPYAYENPAKKLQCMFTEKKQKKEEEFDSPKFSTFTNNASKQSDSLQIIQKIPKQISKNAQKSLEYSNIQNTQNYTNIPKMQQQINNYEEKNYNSKISNNNKSLDISVESMSNFHPQYSFKEYKNDQTLKYNIPESKFAQSFASDVEQNSYRIKPQFLKNPDLNTKKSAQFQDSDCQQEEVLQQITRKYK